MKKWIPPCVCLVHFIFLAFIARQHPFGNFATETDFYHFYAPDAERIASGQFPQNTYQGPGYPAILALLAKLTGADLFTVGKWLSVICAVICGFLIFKLFAKLFGEWTGIGAQLIAIASGEFPQFSINAATDVFFLLLCLIVLAVFTGDRLSLRSRIVLAAFFTGFAYLTRYNGLFLLAACLIGIILINLFDLGWLDRWRLAGIFALAFFVVISPWLYANYRYHGSPLYNTNYLNIATEYFPELVAGKTNQDGTRALEEKFKSFGDVIGYDPKRIVSHFPVVLFESFKLSMRENLVNLWTGLAGIAGILLALITNRTKAVAVILLAGAFYILLMALNHWETRYYFFLMVLYAGFAVFAVKRLIELTRLPAIPKAMIGAILVAALVFMSFRESREDVKQFLASHPTEIIAARDYLNSVNPQGARLKIVARKPHLPYMTRSEWVFFPQVKSIEEFRVWVESHQVDYIAIGKRELKERKALIPLGDPQKAPPWLHAAWVNEDPDFILYKPVVKPK